MGSKKPKRIEKAPPFEWAIGVSKDREGAALLTFVAAHGGAASLKRLEGTRRDFPEPFVDGELLTSWGRTHEAFHVARGAKLVTFTPGDLEVLSDFYEAACSARPPHSKHECRFEIGPRPIAFLGRHVFIGFNAATKKRMTELLEA